MPNCTTYEHILERGVDFMKKYAIVLDIGATWIRIAIGTEEGNFLRRKKKRTRKVGKNGKIVTSQVLDLISSMIEKIDQKSVEGIGIASIGPLDLKRGNIVNPANLPFKCIPLRKPIEDEFNLPVYLLNDGSAGALGEKVYGIGKKIDNLVYITFSTGIGGGAFVDGNLLLGKDGNAVEIGHMVICPEKKLKCGCGKYSHWEAFSGGANLPNFIKFYLKENKSVKLENSLLFKLAKGKIDNISPKILFNAGKIGDKLSLEIIDEIGKINAIGIANIVAAFAPDLIIIGGSIALNNPQLILRPIKKYLRDYVLGQPPKIKITSLGEDIGLYGALAMIFKKANYPTPKNKASPVSS